MSDIRCMWGGLGGWGTTATKLKHWPSGVVYSTWSVNLVGTSAKALDRDAIFNVTMFRPDQVFFE